ncbi:MAG: biotin--[acetyl-CoA-carboxylase] ligase [Okeania sp. SIO1H5]|uniref:biotin--[acetyl-CoA-carboxylase] ligase n=1 Tax=Okeania sp. SIO1H5 TaxID=2607777 RepID=UPI0013BD0143|nr:biotin--[acetyl-CoA-carboxylase] ligase [Okeania sp. SIO1H5]NET23719.1 biotin--[acetyl-CoA-carboxylase] ligase [Okeania sp. SIO1H5]
MNRFLLDNGPELCSNITLLAMLPKIHRIHFKSVTSTQDQVREHARRDEIWVGTADTQTFGRGSRGRNWQSDPGNIQLTCALPKNQVGIATVSLLPLQAGWVVVRLLKENGLEKVELKWPNDALIDGKKVAGILVEQSPYHYLVGIGLNVASHPPDSSVATPATSLIAGYPHLKKRELENSLIQQLVAFFLQPCAEEEFLEQWRREMNWNRKYRVRGEGGTLVHPIDVNAQGHLLVEDSKGARRWLISEYLETESLPQG